MKNALEGSAPVLHLPTPDALERSICATTPPSPPSQDIAFEAAELLAGLPPGAPAEAVLGRLHGLVGRIEEEWLRTPPDGAGLTDRQREYDGYFRVARSSAEPLKAHCQSAVVAYSRFLAESRNGHSLQPVELGKLGAGIEQLVLTLAGMTGVDRKASASAPDAAVLGPAGGTTPLGRWRCGHQLFFVLVQALILVHARLAQALEADDLAAAGSELTLGADLWWAAAAAFRFTADFPEEDYLRVVRPSMTPPNVEEGFSGLFSVDHSHLIHQLRAVRPRLAAVAPVLRRAHRSYLWALDAAYESHAFVCELFVGDGPSLSRSHPHAAHAPNAPTATEVLRAQLKSRALEYAAGRSHRAAAGEPASPSLSGDRE